METRFTPSTRNSKLAARNYYTAVSRFTSCHSYFVPRTSYFVLELRQLHHCPLLFAFYLQEINSFLQTGESGFIRGAGVK